jgi:hypothetical protein
MTVFATVKTGAIRMSSLPFPLSLLDPNLWMRMPLSGNVAQNFHPLTTWFSPQIDIQYVGNPAVERDITANVAGYGSQLGTLIDVLTELTKGKEETDAVKRLRELADKIDEVKQRHKQDLRAAARESLDRLRKDDPESLRRLIAEYTKKGDDLPEGKRQPRN